MEVAILIIACAVFIENIIAGINVRALLKVIHLAVNSNMTRALDEVTQLHKDVTHLVHERNEAKVQGAGLAATEKLAARLILVVDDIQDKLDDVQEKQKLVATNLVTAQQAVDDVASDLAESHARADEVPHDEPAGTAADAGSKSPNGGKEF